jgi:hypothetical protein
MQAGIYSENVIHSNNRSTPNHHTDALNLHATLLPVDSLHKVCHRLAIHLASLLETHPPYAPYHQRAKRFIKSHQLPLHELAFIYNITPDDFEIITAV